MMKGFLLLVLLIPGACLAQEKMRGTIKVRKTGCVLVPGEQFIYSKVDTMPDFPGGGKAGDKWLRENLVYPPAALESGRTGKVMVSFVVMPDGSLAKTEIISSTDAVFNEEAMRLLAKMPKWKPGKCGNKAVAVKYILPMKFHRR